MVAKVLRVLSFIAALLLIAAISLATYKVSILFVGASDNVKLGISTAFVSLIALIYNNNRQQNREISSRHFSEKRQAYQNFFDLLFEYMGHEKSKKAPDSSIERMMGIVKGLMVWASADTINTYNEYMRFSVSENAKRETADGLPISIIHMEKILRSMRKDLGHGDSGLERYGLTKLFIKADEHHKFNQL